MFGWRKRIEGKIDVLGQKIDTLTGKETKDMAALDDDIAQLQNDLIADTSAENSAITLIQAIPGMITTAVNAALAAGATPAQLAALKTLSATLEANTGNLAAAVVAGTTAAVAAPAVAHPGA
jgi:hypothetical protein